MAFHFSKRQVIQFYRLHARGYIPGTSIKVPFSRQCPDRLCFYPASSLTRGEIWTDGWNVILIIHSLELLRCDTRRSYPSCFGSSLRPTIYRLMTLLCHKSGCGPRNVETNRKCQLGRNEAAQNCGKCRNKWRVSCVSVLSETNVKWNILYRAIITSVPTSIKNSIIFATFMTLLFLYIFLSATTRYFNFSYYQFDSFILWTFNAFFSSNKKSSHNRAGQTMHMPKILSALLRKLGANIKTDCKIN